MLSAWLGMCRGATGVCCRALLNVCLCLGIAAHCNPCKRWSPGVDAQGVEHHSYAGQPTEGRLILSAASRKHGRHGRHGKGGKTGRVSDKDMTQRGGRQTGAFDCAADNCERGVCVCVCVTCAKLPRLVLLLLPAMKNA